MRKITQIGIAIIPTEDYALFVRKTEIFLSKKYNTVRGLLQPPHITIKWPFETDDLKKFEDYCAELAREIDPFIVKIKGFGFFEPKVIFLKVVPNKKLLNLHLRILKDMKERFGINSNKFEGKDQQFHTTLAYGDLKESEFYRAKEELEKIKQPELSFKFNKIGLYRYTGEEWVIHKEFEVKNERYWYDYVRIEHLFWRGIK